MQSKGLLRHGTVWELLYLRIKDLNSFSEKFGPGETANIFRAEFFFFPKLSLVMLTTKGLRELQIHYRQKIYTQRGGIQFISVCVSLPVLSAT